MRPILSTIPHQIHTNNALSIYIYVYVSIYLQLFPWELVGVISDFHLPTETVTMKISIDRQAFSHYLAQHYFEKPEGEAPGTPKELKGPKGLPRDLPRTSLRFTRSPQRNSTFGIAQAFRLNETALLVSPRELPRGTPSFE